METTTHHEANDDQMSDPTEVLQNLRELLDCATHRGDQKEQAYLTSIINQIETAWAA